MLTIVISYHVTGYYLKKGMSPFWPVAFWGAVLVFFAFVCGLLIVKIIIDPMDRFVKKTEKLGIIKDISGDAGTKQKKDDISHFTMVFDQVTELLSRVDARELFPEITGRSKAMRGVLNKIIKVAPTDSTVLILGETGTGKELVANSIHAHSLRNKKPFVAINCAAIPENLLESELFGHEKGAFTGADSKKPGKFEIADNGTLFMDEIGDMPLNTQAKILRALQESQIQRLGGVNTVKVNVRIIAATNKDLAVMVEEGKFRRDLFFRLNVFPVYLVPLRERPEDIPALAEKFLETTGKKLGKKLDISSASSKLLAAYNWPGNVRELNNALEAASVIAKDIIEPLHLPLALTRPVKNTKNITLEDMQKGETLDAHIKDLEKTMIIEALSHSMGVQKSAAKLLGIKERSLWHRLKKFEIDAASFKE